MVKDDLLTHFACTNATFYSPTEKDATEAYFRNLTEGLKVEIVYRGEERGKTMVAGEGGFRRGDVVVIEMGVLGMQGFNNKTSHLLKRPLDTSEKKLIEKIWSKSKPIHPCFKPEVPCGGTCTNVYCSENCKSIDLANGHDYLCPTTNPNTDALNTFLTHCERTNEAFYLAAKFFSRIGKEVERGVEMKKAMMPFRMFVKDFWWDVCEPTEEDDPEDFKLILKTLVEDTIGQMRSVFAGRTEIQPILTAEFLALLMGLFERNNVTILTPSPLLAVFGELPQTITEEIIERLRGISARERLGLADGEDYDPADLGEDEDDEFDPLAQISALLAEGTGLHPLQASINHSCTPNAVVYKDDSHLTLKPQPPGGGSSAPPAVYDGRTVVKAIRDIKEGEEILVSYLDDNPHGDVSSGDEEMDEDEKEWRRRSLREYGIAQCGCAKCV
ncbi:hypothetical protein HDU67_005581 [Dinochytrium kinnereticum]|nr:hypothetical protein HDU67_005581 [Dinochytrium kinnereticum]